MEVQVDKQVAAPAENENAQHAPSEIKSLLESADGRMAAAATRQEKNSVHVKTKIDLTPTGLLMEGDCAR